MFLIFNGNRLLNKSTVSNIKEAEGNKSIKEKDDKGNQISISQDGTIYFDETKYFKRYTIKLVDKEEYKGYKEDADCIYLDLNNVDKHKLSSDSFKEQDKNIFLSKNDGTTKLALKKDFSKNNFVFLNQLTNDLLVLISKQESPYSHTVVIDPGHGGADPGTHAYDNSFLEKDVTLKIALEIRSELIFNGKDVVMTRDNELEPDVYFQQPERVAITNESKRDAFVSVHVNSYELSNVYNGVETHYSFKNMYMKESEILAQKVQEKILTCDNWNDRKLKLNDLHVIDNAQMPAVLIECGFASNPDDVRRLNDNQALNNLAKNISAGIIAYLDDK